MEGSNIRYRAMGKPYLAHLLDPSMDTQVPEVQRSGSICQAALSASMANVIFYSPTPSNRSENRTSVRAGKHIAKNCFSRNGAKVAFLVTVFDPFLEKAVILNQHNGENSDRSHATA